MKTALWTGALDVTVGQETPFPLGIELGLPLAVEIPRGVEAVKVLLGNAVVVLSVSVGKQIMTDTQGLLGFQEAAMIMLEELPRWHTPSVGLNGDRCAMGIRAGHHQDAMAFEAVVARKDIGRQQGACDMAEV